MCLDGANVLRNFDLEDVHVEGAERIADAVAKYDVDRFIHVSSFNASLDSPSEFFRTKVCSTWYSSEQILILNRLAERPLFGVSSRKLQLSDLHLCSVSRTAYCIDWLA